MLTSRSRRSTSTASRAMRSSVAQSPPLTPTPPMHSPSTMTGQPPSIAVQRSGPAASASPSACATSSACACAPCEEVGPLVRRGADRLGGRRVHGMEAAAVHALEHDQVAARSRRSRPRSRSRPAAPWRSRCPPSSRRPAWVRRLVSATNMEPGFCPGFGVLSVHRRLRRRWCRGLFELHRAAAIFDPDPYLSPRTCLRESASPAGSRSTAGWRASAASRHRPGRIRPWRAARARRRRPRGGSPASPDVPPGSAAGSSRCS